MPPRTSLCYLKQVSCDHFYIPPVLGVFCHIINVILVSKKYANLDGKFLIYCKGVPLQAWTGPEGSRKLRFPDFVTTAQDGGKVVSFTHRPPLLVIVRG